METFIQSQETMSFFNYDEKSWTASRENATMFPNAAEAVRAVLREGLSHVQFVFPHVERALVTDDIVPFE
jgi:hypothetical protein